MIMPLPKNRKKTSKTGFSLWKKNRKCSMIIKKSELEAVAVKKAQYPYWKEKPGESFRKPGKDQNH